MPTAADAMYPGGPLQELGNLRKVAGKEENSFDVIPPEHKEEADAYRQYLDQSFKENRPAVLGHYKFPNIKLEWQFLMFNEQKDAWDKKQREKDTEGLWGMSPKQLRKEGIKPEGQ